MEKPKMPISQLLYGEFVYWLCIVAAMICTVGPVYAMIDPDNNVMNPHFLFSAIWEGKTAEEVWSSTGGSFPGGHFWIDHITRGDGFTQFGLVIGGTVAFPALIAAGLAFLFERPRRYLWFFMSLWVGALIAISVVGLIGAGH